MNENAQSGSGARLKALRLNAGLPVSDAAKAAGVAVTTLCRLEAGHTPRAATARALGRLYSIDPSDIWMPDVLPSTNSRVPQG